VPQPAGSSRPARWCDCCLVDLGLDLGCGAVGQLPDGLENLQGHVDAGEEGAGLPAVKGGGHLAVNGMQPFDRGDQVAAHGVELASGLGQPAPDLFGGGPVADGADGLPGLSGGPGGGRDVPGDGLGPSTQTRLQVAH
jgi:hypothetical protein